MIYQYLWIKAQILGFGGQVDFIYGASIANDGLGKSIIAFPSRTGAGEPKIVPFLKEVFRLLIGIFD